MDPIISMVLLLTFASSFASLFQRARMSRIVGYVFGGMVLYALTVKLGLSLDLTYSEPLKEVGLILFFFEIGTLLDVSEARKSFSRIVSTELVALTLYWVSASFLSFLLFSSELEKLILFLLLANCSSASIAVLLSSRSSRDEGLVKAVALQASIEDIIQFTIFSLLVTLKGEFGGVAVLMAAIKVSASAVIIYFALSRVLRSIRGGEFLRDPLNKFLFALLIAMSSSLATGALGLPEFFGAFIAGLAFRSSLGTEEIEGMIAGLWELGILLYFSNVGSDVLGYFSSSSWLFELLAGVLIGALSIPIRSISLSLGGILGGMPLEAAVKNSFVLSSLSENGIIFIGMLGTAGGFAASRLIGVAVAAVMVSLLFQYRIVQSSDELTYKVIAFVPKLLRERLEALSKFYYLSVDLALKAFSTTSLFFAALLLITYSLDAAQLILRSINASPELSFYVLTSLRLLGIIGTAVLFLLTLRRLRNIEFEDEALHAKESEALRRYRTGAAIVLSIAAVLIQLNILKDFIAGIGGEISEPEELLLIMLGVAGVLVTVVAGAKRSALAKSSE